jgi:hypothetical protein
MYPDLECVFTAGCDTVLIIENDMPPIPHLETLSWLKRLPYNISTMYNDIMERNVDEMLRRHPDFILIERDTKTPWMKRCYKHIASIMASARRGDENIMVPHRIITLSPEKAIGKLSTLEFAKGDMIAALQHGYDCAKKAIENL